MNKDLPIFYSLLKKADKKSDKKKQHTIEIDNLPIYQTNGVTTRTPYKPISKLLK